MKNYRFFSTIILVFCSLFAVSSFGQSLIEWNFYGTDITGKEATSNACLNDVDLEKAVLTRGAGAPGNSGFTNGFVATLQPSASKDEAIANNVYFEFNLQPKAGNVVNLSELSAQLRTQSASNYQWAYSRDNGDFVFINNPVSIDSTGVGVDQTPINLNSFAILQNLTSSNLVKFRLYVWGGTKVQGFGFGKSGGSSTSGYKASLIVKGSVQRSVANIIGWCLDTNTGVTNGSLNASTIDYNLESAVLSRGDGFVPGSLNFAYVSTTALMGATKAAAIANKEYFQISLKAKSNYKVTLNSLNYKYRRNSSGPANYRWAYSLNGVDFTEIGSEDMVATVSSDGDVYSLDLSGIPDLSNIDGQKTLTLRMYIWGSGASTQVFGLGRYYVGSVAVPTVNAVYFKGKVEPSTATKNISENLHNLKFLSRDHQYILKSDEQFNDPAQMSFIDLSGKTVCKINMQIQSGENQLALPLSLAKGSYIVSVKEKNGDVTNLRVIL